MNAPSPIKEDLLQYVWQTKKINSTNLVTTDGDQVDIKSFGYKNTNSGPDFCDARIILKGIEWAGHVEMHVFSSMWYKHNHQTDNAYNGVILHVVFEYDQEVFLTDGTKLPTLELRDLIDSSVQKKYLQLIQNNSTIPCQPVFPKISDIWMQMWMTKLMVERLERKTAEIEELRNKTKDDWSQIGFVLMSRYLGSQVNGLPMEMLAFNLDLKLILKNHDSLQKLEALFFGQAGLLMSSFDDTYPTLLKQEYQFLQKKYGLQPMDPSIWKFGGIRPANFPTIRLAQLVKLMYNHGNFFRKIIETKHFDDIKGWMKVAASEYWDTHYRFDKGSKKRIKELTDSQLALICINVIAPLIFAYGRAHGKDEYTDRSIALLESIKAEKNSIVSFWKAMGIKVISADQSQSLIQLKKEYCDKIRCLEMSHWTLNYERRI